MRTRTQKPVRRGTRLLVTLLLAACLVGPARSDAKPLMTFLRAVGNSIAHPQWAKKKESSKGKSQTAKKKKKDGEVPPAQPSPSPLSQTATAPEPEAPLAPTAQPTVRVASAAAGGKDLHRDIPYAIPVPNRPGFVTSPYAPRRGLVDVRGFPSGIEVQDPYTGKAFLTP